MKKSMISAAAVTLFVSGFAMAEGPGTIEVQPFQSSLTRAQVQADTVRALRAGELRTAEGSEPARPVVSTRSRTEIAGEARTAARQLDRGFAEIGSSTAW